MIDSPRRATLSIVLSLLLIATACAGSELDSGEQASDGIAGVAVGPTPVVAVAPTPAPDPTASPEPPAPTASPEPERLGEPIDGGVESWFTPRLETVSTCPEAGSMSVACYRLHVAADRDDPTGGTVVLPIREAIWAADERPASAVIIPAGGPGFPGLRTPNIEALTFNRNAVSFDQRGAGLAKPSLQCDAEDAAFIQALQTTDPYEVERVAINDARTACIEALESDGIDLSDYNSIANAHDLEDIRVALGYEQWDVVGISYGARLALTYLREHPTSVRAVLLDSAYDVSYGGLSATLAAADRAFAALAEACAAAQPCAARGDLTQMIERVRLRYNEAPIPYSLPFDNSTTDFMITGDDLIGGLFTAMYITDLLPTLPLIISQLDQGETGIVGQFVTIGVQQATEQANIMAYAMNCSDNANLDLQARDTEALDAPGRYTTVALGYPVCPTDWSATAADFNEPVRSDIPALIVAGGLDPVTPPGPTAALADHLPNSTYLFYPAGGHGVWNADGCIASISIAFITAPTEALDVSCSEANFLPLSPA